MFNTEEENSFWKRINDQRAKARDEGHEINIETFGGFQVLGEIAQDSNQENKISQQGVYIGLNENRAFPILKDPRVDEKNHKTNVIKCGRPGKGIGFRIEPK